MPITESEPGREQVFSAGSLPGDPKTWATFRKKVLTSAVRIQGRFTVATSEGPLTCEDGWLAVDARGYPYPIAADEFEKIYEPAPRGFTSEEIEAAQSKIDALPYRCPDCVTTGSLTCPHPRPVAADLLRGAQGSIG